jgi:hypothetical protein
MTNLPTNLVPTLLRIINDNARGTIMHNSADVRTVRDMLVMHGYIEVSDAFNYREKLDLPDCDEDCRCDMCEG